MVANEASTIGAAQAAVERRERPNGERPRAKVVHEHPFHKLCFLTARIIVQQKGGVILEGNAKWFRKGFLKLTNVKVTGSNWTTEVPWVLIDQGAINHVHPAEGQLEPVDKESTHDQTL